MLETVGLFLLAYVGLAIMVGKWLKASAQQYPEIIEQNRISALTSEEIAFIVSQLDGKWDGVERRLSERRGA